MGAVRAQACRAQASLQSHIDATLKSQRSIRGLMSDLEKNYVQNEPVPMLLGHVWAGAHVLPIIYVHLLSQDIGAVLVFPGVVCDHLVSDVPRSLRALGESIKALDEEHNKLCELMARGQRDDFDAAHLGEVFRTVQRPMTR